MVEIIINGKARHLKEIGGKRTDVFQFFPVFPYGKKQILGYITTYFLVVRQADKEVYQPRLVVEKKLFKKLLCFLLRSPSRYVAPLVIP